jgi:hypothetical protein
MLINVDQYGWIGSPAPLFAGLLIHVVGLVLRAYGEHAKADAGDSERQVREPVVTLPVEVEHEMPTPGSGLAEPEERKLPAPPLPNVVETVPEPVAETAVEIPVPVLTVVPKTEPVSSSSLPAGLDPQEIVFWLLNEAHARDLPLPSGPELTAAVREHGHEINNEYGRTTKARWVKARKKVSA